MDDAESLRQYFFTWPSCEEFYVVPGEPRNNTVLMFDQIRRDFQNDEIHDGASPAQIERRRAITQQLLRRSRARVKEEAQAEAQPRGQIRRIAKLG
jgi:hypothetical protein